MVAFTWIGLAVATAIWLLVWIEYLGSSAVKAQWSKPVVALLYAPFIPILLILAYYAGGGH